MCLKENVGGHNATTGEVLLKGDLIVRENPYDMDVLRLIATLLEELEDTLLPAHFSDKRTHVL